MIVVGLVVTVAVDVPVVKSMILVGLVVTVAVGAPVVVTTTLGEAVVTTFDVVVEVVIRTPVHSPVLQSSVLQQSKQ